jgi:superfamily II DNA or RNA helicase
LCSVNVLSLGFDEPCASCAILARPTLSLAMHIQQVGRVLRIFEGKTDALVFDHAMNLERHGRIEDFEPPDLSEIGKRSDRKSPADKAEADMRACPQCSAVLDPLQRVCHECGHEIGRKNAVDFIPGTLSEDGWGETTGLNEDDLRLYYQELKWIAKSNGYKDGWPYFKLLEEFGFKAPIAWKRLMPVPPRDSTTRLVKSWQIRWAKSQRRAGMTRRAAPSIRPCSSF